MAGLLAADGVTPLATLRRMSAREGAAPTAYQAADPVSQELAGWHPYRGSADGDLLSERPTIDARARDLIRNNGWIAGFRQRQTDKTVGGQGLRLSAKPDYRALGLTAEWAREWGRQVEAEWRQFANDPSYFCDVGRRLDMAGIQAQAYNHYLAEGDALAVLHWREDRPGARCRTAIQVLDPDRLSNPYDQPDESHLRGGIETDADDAPVAYHIRRAHPGDYFADGNDAWTWERIPRETAWGRPIVIHHYDAIRRAGLTRGISALSAVLSRTKMLDKYEGVELQAAVLNAILCAFIESPFDPKALEETLSDGKLGEYQDLRSAYHQQRNLTLGGVKLPALFAGEKIGFQTASRPNAAFASFEAASLRGIAAGLGTSYEELTQDWTQTTYSSARAALLESWFTLSSRRHRFASGFMLPIFGAWLEDVIDLGLIDLPPGAPSFQDARAAYTRSLWLGPGRGWVDPTKEKQGAVMGISAGLSTLEREAAEQGLDWEEVLDQLRVEMKEMPDGMAHPASYEFHKLISTDAPPEPAGGMGGQP